MFGNVVHTLCPDLYLHPFLLGAENCYVQALVTVGFRNRQPVAQTFRVWLVHVGNYRECLPALHFLQFKRGVDDDAYGEEVVYALEAAFLLLHLLPY